MTADASKLVPLEPFSKQTDAIKILGKQTICGQDLEISMEYGKFRQQCDAVRRSPRIGIQVIQFKKW